MIDTDKYEGHTPGPWRPLRLNMGGWTIGNLGYQWEEADKQLIADAPLLLEEVKRLQRYERNHEELWDIIANFSPQDSEADEDIHEQWLESVSQGYMGSVYEYIMMKQEEMIE